MPDLALLVVLLAFTAADIALRELPPGVLIPAAVMLGAGWWLRLWEFSVLALIVPLIAAIVANLPGGDAKALLVLGGMLSWPAAGYMVVALLALTLLLMETVGRHRSLVGFPWMPITSLVVLVVRSLA